MKYLQSGAWRWQLKIGGQVSIIDSYFCRIKISIICVFFNRMNITFLERFQGKTNTITKQGIENALKGTQDTLIYTNTQKSFAYAPSRHFNNKKHQDEESKLSQKQENQQEHLQRQTLHLPSIGERYLPHKNRDMDLSLRGHMRGQIDRQTNWIIENEVRSTNPVEITKNVEVQSPKLKENIVKIDRSTKKIEKRSNSSTKYERLGGLGANIGGEEWQSRRMKQQKAMNYAQRLRKVQRDKLLRSEQEQSRPKINMRSFL